MSDTQDSVAALEGKLEVIAKAVGRVEDVTAQVKRLEDEVKKTTHDARSLAETQRVNRDSVDNALREVGDKYASLEKMLADLRKTQEELGVALRRPHLAESGDGDHGRTVLHAETLHKSILARSQRLNFTNVKMPASFVDTAKAYMDHFQYAIRFDWKMQLHGEVEKALSVGSDPSAGYLVPATMAATILSIVYESTPIAELASSMNLTTPTLSFAIDEGEADVGWVGETQPRPETGAPSVGEQSIVVHEAYANIRVTQQLLDDAGVDIESWLAGKVGEKLARAEASAFIAGDGIKKPRGLLTYPHGTGRGHIEQIPTGNASTVTADAIVKMPFMLKAPYTANATWLMSRLTLAQVALLKDSNNQYLWRIGLENGRPSLLVGYPVRLGEDMPQIAANALVYAFGDFRRTYMIARRLGISMLRDPYTGTPFVRFYFRSRVGGDVINFESMKLGKVAA